MKGPPPLPPSSDPANRSQWRFKDITTLTEWVEHYHTEGFHPVHIGDQLNSSSYRVLRKLGFGASSTVWLAKDQCHDGRDDDNVFVAIKVLSGSASAQSGELGYLRSLSRSTDDHPGRKHVVTLLNHFFQHGPNGRHLCLVLEAMGPSASSMVDLLPERQRARSGMRNRYPKEGARSMLRQVLLGLAYLHQNGIVHGDLQPGNLLFSASGLNKSSDAALTQGTGPDDNCEPVYRRDKKEDKWAPKYLAASDPLSQFIPAGSDLEVKLSDLGGAFSMSRPQGRTATPLALRAPELILGDRRTKSQDIWSFGCLVFEFLTGYALLTVWDDSEGDPETIDEFFLVLSDTLGPLPSFLRSGWPNASLYYDNEGKMIKNYIGDPPSPPVFDPKTNMVEGFSLEDWFDESKPADVGPEERKEIIALLRHILQYDEKLRPSAEELLQHPWISGL